MGKSDTKARSTTKATKAGAVSVPGTQNNTAGALAPAPVSQAGAVPMPGASGGQNAKHGLRRRSAADDPKLQEEVASARVGAVATASARGGQNAKPGLRRRSAVEENDQPVAVASRPAIAEEDTPRVGAVRSLGEPKAKREMRESLTATTTTVAGIDVVDIVDVDNIPTTVSPRAGAVRSNSGRRLGESKAKREMRESRGRAAAPSPAATVAIGSANRTPASTATYQEDMSNLEAKLGTSRELNMSKSKMMEEGLLQDRPRTSVAHTEPDGPERPYDSRRATAGRTITGDIDDSELVTARPVDEEENLAIPAADAWDQEKEAKAQAKRQQKATRKNRIFMAVGFLVVAAIVLVAVLLTRNRGEDTLVVANATSSPTLSPTAAPTWKGNSILELLPDFTKNAILEGDTPQRQAYDWLVEDPAWSSYSDTRLLQRFALATYYLGTGGAADWANSQMQDKWIFNATFGWMEYGVHECDWAVINVTDSIDLQDGALLYERVGDPCVARKPEDASDEERIYEHFWLPYSRFSSVGSTIPPEVYLLTNLKSLWLAGNTLTGTISSLVGQLTDLEVFSLPYNTMTGNLPQEFADCTNLLALSMTGQADSSKVFTGTLPTFLFEIQTLKHLTLDVHNFTGSIPSEIGLLTNLETLVLSENLLDQSIPTEIGQLLSLKEFKTYENALTGPLPSELGLLESLKYLDVSWSSHAGGIPSELGLCEDLRQLHAQGNNLQGSLPTELGQLGVLENFWLQYNYLTGSIISELGMLTSLTGDVQLNGNELTGTIPTELGLLSSAFFLSLSENRISGTIPSEFGQMSGLVWLWARSNMVSLAFTHLVMVFLRRPTQLPPTRKQVANTFFLLV